MLAYTGKPDSVCLEDPGGNSREKARILVITGPTASGKSRLSMDIASLYPVEIISADSMQVYKYMDIGTDKPSLNDRSKVPHHLIDIKFPYEPWSVEEFQRRAGTAVKAITARGNIPCLVGGTGLYIRAFLQSYPLTGAPPDAEFRREMRELAARQGNRAVHDLLLDKDPRSHESLHPNDLKRVIRALEYFRVTGRPISSRMDMEISHRYDPVMLGLQWNRDELYKKIDNRVDDQFRRGVIAEVKSLMIRGYSHRLRSMQGLVYKEVCNYLLGLTTERETRELVKRNTRRFARRQFTWFGREEGIIWITAGNDRLWSDIVAEACRAIHAKGLASQSPGNSV